MPQTSSSSDTATLVYPGAVLKDSGRVRTGREHCLLPRVDPRGRSFILLSSSFPTSLSSFLFLTLAASVGLDGIAPILPARPTAVSSSLLSRLSEPQLTA